jgi:hypothetical protein
MAGAADLLRDTTAAERRDHHLAAPLDAVWRKACHLKDQPPDRQAVCRDNMAQVSIERRVCVNLRVFSKPARVYPWTANPAKPPDFPLCDHAKLQFIAIIW